MAINSRPLVIAAFADRSQAERALRQLRDAGFGDDQIRYWGGASDAGVIDTLKSVVSRQAGSSSQVYEDLTGLGTPEADAEFFRQQADAGRPIVAVMAAARQQEAFDLLASCGGYGSGTRAGLAAAGSSAAGSVVETAAQTAGEGVLTETEETRRLRLREEQLRVEKQAVQTGEVRLGKEVVTEQQTITVPTTHEEVYIERRPGSGPFTSTAWRKYCHGLYG